MTTEQVLSGIGLLGQVVGILPEPLSRLAGLGLRITADAVRVGSIAGIDPALVLEELRATLRARVTADWQAALDDGDK